MSTKLTILGVHGLGDHRQSTWKEDWAGVIRDVFPMQDEIELDFKFITYDPLFETVELSAWEQARAVAKLLRSGASSPFQKKRGLFGDVSQWMRWHAGYVVAWVEDQEFQEKTRQLVLDAVREYKPDIMLAHSLGSLITYNTLAHPDAATSAMKKLLKSMTYVTLGSQIGNAFVVGNLTAGRIEPLNVKWWHHLYNEEDDVFTAPIQLWDADNFSQVETFFDLEDNYADHDALEYLSHEETIQRVWTPLASAAAEPAVRVMTKEPKAIRPLASTLLMPGRGFRDPEPRRRALLVGINDYPDPAARLEGCVNDVFLMSSVLQECGFRAEDIRVCLNERATADGVLSRMQWLMDDPEPNDELFFYYSGHGAQLPTYGEGDVVDGMDETLVSWDFDWTPETCVTDDQIHAMYSQLPYETKLVMMFDCCHSGGMHRDGGFRVRGLTPPDDIRHRALRWDVKEKMWVPRDFKAINKDFTNERSKARRGEVMRQFFGANEATRRIGRASMLRPMSAADYNKVVAKAPKKRVGPYLPVIVEACREDQYSYEYRHGVSSYGAFTYSLAQVLRQKKQVTFADLIVATREKLKRLNYDQEPQILGPGEYVNATVPWMK